MGYPLRQNLKKSEPNFVRMPQGDLAFSQSLWETLLRIAFHFHKLRP